MHASCVCIGALVHRVGFLFGYVDQNGLQERAGGLCLTSSHPHCRGGHPSYVWGLRGPAALDGAHQPPAIAAVVYIRSAILGFRLPPVDRLSFLALRQNVGGFGYTCAPLSPLKNSGSFIDASWFALDTSRGIETPTSKLFMRSTVILSDYAIYVPAMWLFTRVWHSGRSRRTQVFLNDSRHESV